MKKQFLKWAPLSVLALFLPLSLSIADTIFYECVDNDGTVYFRYDRPGRNERCLVLGAREDRRATDEKVRKYFAENDGSMPRLRGSLIENGERSLRSFNAKLKGFADPVTIYFLGDSHLHSGDFIRGFLDGLAGDYRVEGDLCVHLNGKTQGRKRRSRSRPPSDFPAGVPRTCSSLKDPESGTTGFADGRAVFNDGDVLKYGAAKNPLITARGYAISGKTFAYFSGSVLMEQDLQSRRPDLIVVMLGTNDAFARPEQDTIKRDITQFVRAARRASPASEILFIAPPDSYFKDGSNNEYIGAVGRELRAAAREQGTAFWDLFRVMGGQGSMSKWRDKGLSQKDRIHFLADGYFILGRLFSQALTGSGTAFSRE